MTKLKTYIEESYNELMHKVTWPTWSELQSTALLVMFSSIIIALMIFAMDFSFSHVMDLIYKMFKNS
jgi:preprotein translocase subunit SecE